MARPRQFEHAQTIKLKQLEHALVTFYADVHRLDASKVIRSMIRNYVLADATFDAKAFQRFVNQRLVPDEHDPAATESLREQINMFLNRFPKTKRSR